MEFTFTVITDEGNITKGALEAQSQQEAIDKLHQNNYLVVDISAKRHTKYYQRPFAIRPGKRKKIRFLSWFTQQLSMLCMAGLPFLDCLDVISDETGHPLYREAVERLRHDIAQGMSFADSLEKQPYLFPSLLIKMTAAAEATGNIDKIYHDLSRLYEKELQVINKTIDAAAYPLFVLAIAVVGVVGVTQFLLPQWSQALSYTDASLPLLTLFIMRLAQTHFWIVTVMTTIFLGLVFAIIMHSPAGVQTRDYLLLRVPILGHILARYHWARICYCLGLCLNCGIPLLTAIDVAQNASLNRHIAKKLGEIQNGVKAGISLSYQLRTLQAVPKMLIPLVRIGEESGSLTKIFLQAAEMLNTDVDNTLDRLVKWLEPALIIITGLIVGFVVFGLMMPLFTLMDVLR